MANREYVNFGIVILSAFVIARLIFNSVLRYINQLKQNLNEANEFINVITTQKKKLEIFNAIAAHDLRTPIRQIIGFSGLAQKWEISKDQKSQLDEYIEHISKAGYRMSELTDSISLLEKVSNETEVPYTSVDIYSVISDIESTNLKHNFDNYTIHNNSSHSIQFNFSHLHLVLYNLICNALKFNIQNEKIVTITTELKNGSFYIHVRDNGIGIEEKFIARIFEPFSKLHNHEKYKGSGLGLYIARQIIMNYDGHLACSQNADGGSTFSVVLPSDIIAK
jgi:signal transduction histidine kinase